MFVSFFKDNLPSSRLVLNTNNNEKILYVGYIKSTYNSFSTGDYLIQIYNTFSSEISIINVLKTDDTSKTSRQRNIGSVHIKKKKTTISVAVITATHRIDYTGDFNYVQDKCAEFIATRIPKQLRSPVLLKWCDNALRLSLYGKKF